MANRVDFIIGAADEFSGTFEKLITAMKKPAVILGAITIAAGAATAALISMTNRFAQTADATGKFAGRIGTTAQNLSELQFAATKTKVPIASLEMGLQRMTRRVAEAAKGTGEAKDALKELNLNAEELSKSDPADIFMEVTAAMEGVEDQSDKVRLAMKLFDSEGVGLLQTMEGGAAGLEEMRKEARDFGVTISDVAARDAARFNDSILDLKSALKGMGTEMSEELLAPLAQLNELVTDALTQETSLVKEFTDSWAKGMGIIVDNWTTGTRKILGLQEQVRDSAEATQDAVKKGGAPEVDVRPAISALKAIQDEVAATQAAMDASGQEAIPLELTFQDINVVDLRSDLELLKARAEEIKLGGLDSQFALDELGKLEERASIIKEQLAILAAPALKLDALLNDFDTMTQGFEETKSFIEESEPASVTLDTAEAVGKLFDLKTELQDLNGTTVTVKVNVDTEGEEAIRLNDAIAEGRVAPG
jgi:hypothetical protein